MRWVFSGWGNNSDIHKPVWRKIGDGKVGSVSKELLKYFKEYVKLT